MHTQNEDDTWAVHRFDLSSSTMRTFLFYAEGERKKLPDGRPFSWWHASVHRIFSDRCSL
jgi:hypothetical protein